MKLIVARDSNGGIGINNTLPWPSIKEDMKWFKECTTNSTVVMGRKTFESLGSKPLSNRHNIVITSEPDKYVAKDNLELNLEFMTVNDLTKSPHIHLAWLIGGSTLYKTLLPYVTEAYITEVEGVYECDSYFPVNLKNCGFCKIMSSKIADGVRVVSYRRCQMRAREFHYSYLDFHHKTLMRKGSLAYKLRRNKCNNGSYRFWMENSLRHCNNKTPNRFYIKAYNSTFSRTITAQYTKRIQEDC